MGAFLLSALCSCTSGSGKIDPYEGAILVPVAAADRHELAALLASFSHRSGYYLRDSSNYMRDATGTLTFWVVAFRGLNGGEEWAEIQASALADDYPIITFNRPLDPALSSNADKAWAILVSGVKQRWPSSGDVPILPHGGIPHGRDLVATADGYRIDRAKATTYELPPSSPLLAN